jgi:hypothetical protein
MLYFLFVNCVPHIFANLGVYYLSFLDLYISEYEIYNSRHKLSEMTKVRKFGKLISLDREFDYELKV